MLLSMSLNRAVVKGHLSSVELEKIRRIEAPFAKRYDEGTLSLSDLPALWIATCATAAVIVGDKFYGFTLNGSKNLSDSDLIADTNMNERGLHIMRVVYSHYNYMARAGSRVIPTGLMMLKDFLPDDQRKNVARDIDLTHWFSNKQPDNMPSTPAIMQMIDSSGMKEFVARAAGLKPDDKEFQANYKSNTFIQRLVIRPDDNDEQKVAHSDIFFPAVKFWYFPDRVEDGLGAFNYTTGHNNQLTYKMLDMLYTMSVEACFGTYAPWRGRGHVEGSFRFSPEELAECGMSCDPVPVEANTLVIANVFWPHRRGDTIKKVTRSAIHGSIRVKQPFRS